MLGISAANAVVVDFTGTFTDNYSHVTAGDNAPAIVNNGLASPFSVDNLVAGGPAGTAQNNNGLLFTVDPAGCLNASHCNGTSSNYTETADITVNFSFYSPTNVLLGTLSDTALATFRYWTYQDDNFCWLDNSVSGSAGLVVSHQLVNGTCGGPGTGTPKNGFAYEQIEVNLGGILYYVDLYDWNDWDEQPNIKFQEIGASQTGGQGGPTPIPEPLTLSLFGASLAGAAALRRRRASRDR
ncbi:MAG TPA: PEP-CTERM sorting domain-containing protein [Rhizomicrobium sp.]|nr:PEP-CTERM sorting domain-containing protein [Rhizomicrobium sp.]